MGTIIRDRLYIVKQTKDRVYIMAHKNEAGDTFRLRLFRGRKEIFDDEVHIDTGIRLFGDLFAIIKGALGSRHPEGRDGGS